MSTIRVISVLSRTPDPRTCTEIAWHLPELSLSDVQRALDALGDSGELMRITGADGSVRYMLVPDDRLRRTYFDSWLPNPALTIAFLVGLAVFGTLAFYGLVFLGRLMTAMMWAAM